MSGSKDYEGGVQKIPYPKSVFFIIICEFCERFCFYGMKTVLTLYFVQVLNWSENTSTVIFHLYVMVAYFTPLIGAMLADSFLGKFRTIFYLGVVYCAGCVVLTLAATPPISLPTVTFSLVGLVLIAIGTGGIKPCVSAFGADQFKLPEQEVQVASYFAMFYFAINSGSLVSTLLTPILREDVKCFDDDHCYSLAFAVPGGLMIFALVVFLFGRPMYKVNDPEGNVVLKLLGAVKYALGNKKRMISEGKTKNHWMDYAEDKYGMRFVAEAKVVLKVLFLYLPLPIFWALFDQQGSRWTLQATRTDGDTFGWVIKPDQLQVVNPVLVLIFIPVFDKGIYPLLAKFGLLKKPLQRLTVGGIFAAISFIVSGLVEISLESTYATVLKSGESNVHVINSFQHCSVTFDFVHPDPEHGGHVLYTDWIVENHMLIQERIDSGIYNLKATIHGGGDCEFAETTSVERLIVANSEEAKTYLLMRDLNGIAKLVDPDDEDDMEKADSGNPKLRFVYDINNLYPDTIITGLSDNGKHSFRFDLSRKGPSGYGELEPTKYDFYINHGANLTGFKLAEDVEMKLGAVYAAALIRATESPGDMPENYRLDLHQVTKANNVHMLLMIPQFIIMTMGEIMFSITIMDFSYAEGPPSMKSVMQSAWLMTVAFGNLVVVIIAEAQIFDKQWKEFFLFAGIMFGAMGIFAYLAHTYEPTDRFWLRENNEFEDEKDKKKKDGNENDALEAKNE